jgi:hypothetical protein
MLRHVVCGEKVIAVVARGVGHGFGVTPHPLSWGSASLPTF